MGKRKAATDEQRGIPFPIEEELNAELRVVHDDKQPALQLCRAQRDQPATLPGNAFVELTFEDIWIHLEATLLTNKLDALAPHLWLVATQSSSSISPLHKQRILGREIIVTDTADLHLVWYYSKIFVKPLPRYLLSHAFWAYIFSDHHPSGLRKGSEKLYAATLGFVRTYCHLIRSETDFRLATGHGLIPEDVDFEHFARFIKHFRPVADSKVSPRFHYGELRLTRLNLWSTVFLHQAHYFNMSRQYETYFSRFFQPLLFTFGIFSVLLSAMQVALAAGESAEGEGHAWGKFVSVSKWTAIVTIIIVVSSVVWLLVMFSYKLLNELLYALASMAKRHWYARRNANIV